MSNARAERRRSIRDAKKLLESEHLFNKFLHTMESLGLEGEKRNALVLFVVETSRVLNRPLNLFVKGHSSAGKNWLITRTLRLLPKSALAEITSLSDQAVSYSGSTFRHRVVYLQERNEIAGAIDPLRLLISEGEVVRFVPGFKNGKRVVTKHVARGPIAAISTSTKNLKIDDETRHISIWIDESPRQTRDILRSYVEDRKRLSREDIEAWRRLHRLLAEKVGIIISIPSWFAELAEEVFVDNLRVRRYFPAFVEACRAMCLIRSFLPHRQNNCKLEIDFADFAITTLIFDQVFVESLHLVGPAEETRKVVETIAEKTGKPVRAKDLARELNISMDKAYAKLRYASTAGAVRSAGKPEKSNRKKYLPAPAVRFVPNPETLFHKLKMKEQVSFVHPLTGKRIIYKPTR